MDFNTKLKNYAELIVRHGLNIQPGQVLNISAELCHRRLVNLVAEQAYHAGAKLVVADFSDPRIELFRLKHVAEEHLEYVPRYVGIKYSELVDEKAANLRILGMENPDIFSNLDPKRYNISRIARYKAVKYFYDEGIGKSHIHWCLVAAATQLWGQKLFPELGPEEAKMRLWEDIFSICRVDRPDFMEVAAEHNTKLQERARKLTALGIVEIHFVGPGTDLRVGLSDQAVFKGGADTGPYGVQFEPNIPSEECFTTPDWRKTRGVVKATRPFYLNGEVVKDLSMQFENGEIISYSAVSGEKVFSEYIQSDRGAKRLGEVALVGMDSPVYQSGLVFQEILFDENAACHIAIGSAYKFCISSGDSMEEDQLNTIGFNQSSTHTDIMISSEYVDVNATTRTGDKVALLRGGAWTEF